jgi:hypothetical protein
LAPPALTSGYTRHLVSRGIYAGSLGVALLALIWCGVNVYRTVALRNDARSIAGATRLKQQEYQQMTRSFPPTPVPSDRLQLTVDVSGRIASIGRLPDTLFIVVSHTLERYPSVRLNGVRWKLGRAGSDAAGGAALVGPLSQSAMLQMELTAQPGDMKGVLSTINSFVRELGKNDKVAEARVAKMPVNLASSESLSGSTASPHREQVHASQFDVEVTLKPGV